MSISSKQRAVEEARRALLLAERALRDEQLRTAEPKAGSRILIRATFPHGEKVYEYLALRTEGSSPDTASWYVTGRYGKQYWDDILALVKNASFEILPLKFTF